MKPLPIPQPPRAAGFAATLAALAMLALASPPGFAIEIKSAKLSSGATLLVSEQHQLPMVTMAIAFDGGSRRDPKGKEGLAYLTANALTQGTKDLTVDQFNQKVHFMGSAISVDAGQDYAQASFTSLKRYQNDTLRLLSAVLLQPGMRDADIVRKRDEQVAAIKAEEEQPSYVARVAFKKLLYGDGPYGHPEAGSSESVAKLTPEDARDFYRDHYKLGGAVIAVVGDVNAGEIKDALEAQLAGLRGAVPAETPPQTQTVPSGLHPTMIDRDVAQANLILGFQGIARSNPDYYRLQVMNYILGGGGFASRLTKVVRSKEGLAYSIGSGFAAGLFPGAFEIVLQTKNRSATRRFGSRSSSCARSRSIPYPTPSSTPPSGF